MTTLAEALRATPWARALDAQSLARVESETIERAVAAGGYVCRKGEAVNQWVGVIDGLVRLSAVSPEGKVATLAGVPGGGWFGEGSLQATRGSRSCRARRSSGCSARASRSTAMLEYERLMDPESRVARCLSWLFNPILYPAGSPTLEISQEEVGNLCGFSRQRVNQALQALERQGLLRVEYGAVTILDLQGLRQR